MSYPKCMLLAAVALAVKAHSYGNTTEHSNGDQTSVTTALNNQMLSQASAGVYRGGKGILVRTPDFFSGAKNNVVPASFWVNDIQAPNTLYPIGNPWCPNNNWDGFQKLDWSKCDFPGGPWAYATVAAVIGEDGLRNLFDDFDNIQGAAWGWGVFYASDANSCDQRCRNLESSQGYDCPGYWVPYDGMPLKDSTKGGAGFYNQGNPYAGKQGGGAGCHFDGNRGIIDQTDAITANNQNLVGNGDCECNYIFRDDWSHWVEDWIANSKQKKGEESRNWLAASGNRAPQWGVDTAICWVNNPRDMILLQNALWAKHASWLNGEAPQWGAPPSGGGMPYWGWNEVPVDRVKVESPTYWDSVMIKLPLGYTSVTQLGTVQKKQLETDLNTWRLQKKLLLGGTHAQARPGSYIVFAKELETKQGSAKYYRNFFCENWLTPTKWFRIVSKSIGAGSSCYIESGPAFSQLPHSDVMV